jgi:signal transduction histidine kinase
MFLSNVSHELRTPMAGIMGLLDLVLADELLPEQAVRSQILVLTSALCKNEYSLSILGSRSLEVPSLTSRVCAWLGVMRGLDSWG